MDCCKVHAGSYLQYKEIPKLPFATLASKTYEVAMKSANWSESQQGRQLLPLEPTSPAEADYHNYSIPTCSEFSPQKTNMVLTGSSLITILNRDFWVQ